MSEMSAIPAGAQSTSELLDGLSSQVDNVKLDFLATASSTDYAGSDEFAGAYNANMKPLLSLIPTALDAVTGSTGRMGDGVDTTGGLIGGTDAHNAEQAHGLIG